MTMKVLHVHNRTRFRGGGDRVAAATVRGLREAGIEVEEFLRDSRDLTGLTGPFRAFGGGLGWGRTVGEFETALAETRPDLVHVHELYPLISPWILPACDAAGVPVVMSVHEYRLTCPVGTQRWGGAHCQKCLDRGWWWAARRNCRGRILESLAYGLRFGQARRRRLHADHVDCFVTASEHMRGWLVRAGFAAERVRTVPFPIELPTPPPREGDGDYMAFVGRMVPEKGIHTLAQAARRAELPLRWAGPNEGGDATEFGDWVGELRGADLVAFYAGARFVVVPSTWAEPYGLVAGEAQLARVPVIASRIGGLPELVDDGETGLLVPPQDAEALAQAMMVLWQDPERCRAMGELGRERIQARCGMDAYIDSLSDVYRDTFLTLR